MYRDMDALTLMYMYMCMYINFIVHCVCTYIAHHVVQCNGSEL